MKEVRKLNVFYHGRKVGAMALYKGHFAAFEYEKEWLADGFSISPFSLPLELKCFFPEQSHLTVYTEYLQTAFQMDGGVSW